MFSRNPFLWRRPLWLFSPLPRFILLIPRPRDLSSGQMSFIALFDVYSSRIKGFQETWNSFQAWSFRCNWNCFGWKLLQLSFRVKIPPLRVIVLIRNLKFCLTLVRYRSVRFFLWFTSNEFSKIFINLLICI